MYVHRKVSNKKIPNYDMLPILDRNSHVREIRFFLEEKKRNSDLRSAHLSYHLI